MIDQPQSNLQKALAFATRYRRWLATAFFGLCALITPRIGLPSIGWQSLGVLTTVLLVAAALGHSPYGYGRFASQQKLMLYGVSAAGFVLLIFVLIAGNPLSEGLAETAVRAVLKDPDSAKFGRFYLNSETGRGCLVVNAKNAMGGYTGDQFAEIQQKGDHFEVDQIIDEGWNWCMNYANY